MLLFIALPARAGLSVSLGSIDHPSFKARDLALQLGEGEGKISIGRLQLLGREFKGIRAECSRLLRQPGGVECLSATLSAAGYKEKLPLRFSYLKGVLTLDLEPGDGERWHVERTAAGAVSVRIEGGRLERMAAFMPLPRGWTLNGRLRGEAALDSDSIDGDLTVSETGFSDPSGEHAAEKLAATLRVKARLKGETWDWNGQLRWAGGEALWQPFYAKAEGQTLAAHGTMDSRRVSVASARLVIPKMGELSAGAEWDRLGRRLVSARLESSGLELAERGASYLNPILAQHGVPEMEFGGRLSFSLHADELGLKVAGVGLNDIALRETHGRFAATGIYGGLPWHRESSFDGYLKVGSAKAGDFQFGSFELPIAVQPKRFSIQRTEIPFLNSQLVVEHLIWRKSTKRQAWEGDLSLSILPVPLADLTKAFGLPAMAGTLSGSFPHLRYREGAAYLDGALVIQVFDGYLNITKLRLDDPFGTVPRLTGDIDARRINLGQLTDTFSFGSITGFADAEIKDLELAGWKPVHFDAWIASSPGDYRKRISQRAVQNISALGGAGAAAALQATFLRFFEQFGYEKIGLSCKLRGGVCEMGGVENVRGGYVMVKGGGVPALTVIGYNRHVDWVELVSRLRDAVQNNVRPVIK